MLGCCEKLKLILYPDHNSLVDMFSCWVGGRLPSLLVETSFCDPADKDGNGEEDKDSTSPSIKDNIFKSNPSPLTSFFPHKVFAQHVVTITGTAHINNVVRIDTQAKEEVVETESHMMQRKGSDMDKLFKLQMKEGLSPRGY